MTQKFQDKEKLSGAKKPIIDKVAVWVVRCDDSGEHWETSRVCDTAMTMTQMLETIGRDLKRRPMLNHVKIKDAPQRQ